jgi:hypothetical protein
MNSIGVVTLGNDEERMCTSVFSDESHSIFVEPVER